MVEACNTLVAGAAVLRLWTAATQTGGDYTRKNPHRTTALTETLQQQNSHQHDQNPYSGLHYEDEPKVKITIDTLVCGCSF